MAYGTPFLLQLGLSKSLMSLVWLAGPLSGLVMQPVVGVLSDRCTSKLGRRRPFLIVGVTLVVVSFLCLGWCREIIHGIFGEHYPNLENATIIMAVGSIYILDFAINCVQASCRTLIVDSLPSSQQEAAASWASRLMGIGGIFGYFMGNVNLPERIPIFGDTQIKGLCILACLFLVMTVGLTCFTVSERVMVRAPKSSTSSIDQFLQGFRTIFRAIRYLPTRIQYLCNVQFFAWMGWFPFLFYSSTYIAEIYTREMSQKGAPIEPTNPTTGQEPVNGVQDAAVRAGSFCLLIYSIISLAASILLPVFVAPAEQVNSGSNGPFLNSRSVSGPDNLTGGTKRQSTWRRLRLPPWLCLPIQGLTLPRMYTLSLALVSFSLISTWYIRDLRGSTVLFAFCGISWAVSMWAPFSILGEVISQQMQEEQHQERIRGEGGQAQRGDSVEVLFPNGDDNDVSDAEEIRMNESSHDKQYHPVSVRGSLDEAVAVTESNIKGGRPNMIGGHDSFLNSSGTPSPTMMNGQFITTAPMGWTAPTDQGKAVDDIMTDSDTEAEDNRRSEDEDDIGPRNHGPQDEERSHSGLASSSAVATPTSASTPSEASSAGALLGIHNIYIVLPQFLVSFLSSLVFAAIEPKTGGNAGTDGGVESDQPGDPETIGVMLRVGGFMAGIAALLSLRLWTQPRSAAPLHHS
ncbi:hypothetical protein EDD11_010254 [Mortierella claussenii]|nr:hypothetical protein EDD11_010254 [Mortierella claussenii]